MAMSKFSSMEMATEGDVKEVRLRGYPEKNKRNSTPEVNVVTLLGYPEKTRKSAPAEQYNPKNCSYQQDNLGQSRKTDMTDVKRKLSKYLNTIELPAEERDCIQGYYIIQRKPDESPQVLVVNVNSGSKQVVSQSLLYKFLEYLKQMNPALYEGITINNFKIVEQTSAPRLSAWKSNGNIQFKQVGSIAFIAKYNDVTEGSNNGVGAVVACHTVTDEAIVRGTVTGKLLDQVNNAQIHFTVPFEGVHGFNTNRQEVGERSEDELPAVDLGMLYLRNHTGERPIMCKIFHGNSADLPYELSVFKKDDASVTGSVIIKSFSGPLFPGKPAYGHIMVVRAVRNAQKFADVGESGRAVLYKENGEEYLLGYIVAAQDDFSHEDGVIDHVSYILYLHHGFDAFRENFQKDIIVHEDEDVRDENLLPVPED